MRNAGMVYLVGAGPGDPGLITVRGLACLRQAQVIMHDRLIHPDLLLEASATAECVDVGKMPHDHPYPQSTINALLMLSATSSICGNSCQPSTHGCRRLIFQHSQHTL
jgi:uroporphyrin-III C-methyltransferase